MKAKKRAFVSFDDKILKNFVFGQFQKGDSPLQVDAWSSDSTSTGKSWEEQTKEKIVGSDVVSVIIGDLTHRALGVLREVEMAREASVPVYQFVGYKDSIPDPIPGAGPLLRWKWRDVKEIFS